MKVIFLDIDGVLNVMRQEYDDHGQLFHDHLVDNLQYIIDNTGADIVISSSWRHSGLKAMKQLWADRKLPGNVIDITPNLSCLPKGSTIWIAKIRGEEIQEWLDKHPEVTQYVIIDDDKDMLQSQVKNFVQCSNNISHKDCIDIGYGLTKQCADKAINILL